MCYVTFARGKEKLCTSTFQLRCDTGVKDRRGSIIIVNWTEKVNIISWWIFFRVNVMITSDNSSCTDPKIDFIKIKYIYQETIRSFVPLRSKIYRCYYLGIKVTERRDRTFANCRECACELASVGHDTNLTLLII